MGPLDKGAPWSTDGIPGCFRFLQRAWRLFVDEDATGEPRARAGARQGTPEQARLHAHDHRRASPTTSRRCSFNTAISKLMVFVRDVGREAPVPRDGGRGVRALLSPLRAAPGRGAVGSGSAMRASIALAPWPVADAALLVAETITLRGAGERQAARPRSRSPRTRARTRFARRRSPRRTCAPSRRARAEEGDRGPGRLVNVVG